MAPELVRPQKGNGNMKALRSYWVFDRRIKIKNRYDV